jgi:hypothetical protein
MRRDGEVVNTHTHEGRREQGLCGVSCVETLYFPEECCANKNKDKNKNKGKKEKAIEKKKKKKIVALFACNASVALL